MVRKKTVLIIIVAILTIYWLAPKLFVFFQIDSCLDSGGAFDYVAGTCIRK